MTESTTVVIAAVAVAGAGIGAVTPAGVTIEGPTLTLQESPFG